MDGDARFMHVVRKELEPERFRNVLVFKVPSRKFAGWSPEILSDLLHYSRAVVESYLNRPGIAHLRLADAGFYMVLALRRFNRGPPMLPERHARESCTSISSENPAFRHWSMFPANKLRLADYLNALLKRLGHDLATYSALDGSQLVPYQCAVPRGAWEEVRGCLLEALRYQKKAYRRAYGGTTAPTLVEDVQHKVAPWPCGVAHS